MIFTRPPDTSLRYRPVPLIVPPVPMPATKTSTAPSVSAQISGPVVARWIAGFAATRRRYWAGIAHHRPYAYFLVANLAAFALAVGPAAAVALAWLRDRGVWLLAGSALAVVGAADLSGLSKGEVERIWLPFVPWILVATAALAATRERAHDSRSWLAAQAATGLVLQLAVRSPW